LLFSDWYRAKTSARIKEGEYRVEANLKLRHWPGIMVLFIGALPILQPRVISICLHISQLPYPEASPYQYMFGCDLLICPVVEESVAVWSLYLPGGDWFDFWTRKRFTGNQIAQVPVPLERIPVFVPAGAAIPVSLAAGTNLGECAPLSTSANNVLNYS
jgi:hypothetical protein